MSRTPKKRSNASTTFTGNEATSFILTQLLTEFKERKLTMSDLYRGYQGTPPKELKERSAAAGIEEVDFDLAMKDLIGSALIDTGPKEPYENDLSSGVLILALRSKNEYSYLKEKGYRHASELGSSKQSRSHDAQRSTTILHGDQYYNYGQAAAVGPNSIGTINAQQWTAVQNDVDFNALIGELEKLRKHLQQSASSSSDYQALAALSEAENHAKKHDGSGAMDMLSKVGKGVLGVARDIGTEIAAKVIAKSMGIEP